MSIDAVVTHHTDGFRSGVARFNELLAARLGVSLLGISSSLVELRRPLLSFKVLELGPAEAMAVAHALDEPGWEWEVFLHEFSGLELEEQLVRGAARVFCGNAQIQAAVESLNGNALEVWTPGLVADDRPFPDVDVSVFSFGMAHKIRTDMFERLKELLEDCCRRYAIYVSAANHETTLLRDAEAVYAEMHALFGGSLYFLGNLSDVAVAHWLRATTYFTAFFPDGVRSNNTSVAAAMERGSVVVTNLDAFSPSYCVHARTVLDINQLSALPTDPAFLQRIRSQALAAVRRRGWDDLIPLIQSPRG